MHREAHLSFWDDGFHGACRGGHIDIAEAMIQMAAKDFGLGLKDACQRGHLPLIKHLLNRGIAQANESACSLHCGGC